MEETTEKVTQPAETTAPAEGTAEAKATETAAAKPPEAEAIPKYRYDELLEKFKESEAVREKALDYIRAYTQQATQPQAPKQELTEAERLARIESAVYNMYKQTQENQRAELEADKALAAFNAELATKPHLKDFSKEIWEDITLSPNRPVADTVGKWHTVVTKSKAQGVTESVKPKKAVAGHRTLAGVSGSPPSTIASRTDRLRTKEGKVLPWEDFWDETRELVAEGLREAKVARGELED